MSKKKGTRYERELLQLFWGNKWGALRSPGSGSSQFPSPDILASNADRILAIECKSIKGTNKFIEKEKIEQLKEFSGKFGAESWVGMRFDNHGWFFLALEDLKTSESGNFSISLELAKEKGLSFKELIKR